MKINCQRIMLSLFCSNKQCKLMTKKNVQKPNLLAASRIAQNTQDELLQHKNEPEMNNSHNNSSSSSGGDDERMCKICFEHEYSTALMPCGHVIACGNCSRTLKFCAICRKFIDSIIKIYF